MTGRATLELARGTRSRDRPAWRRALPFCLKVFLGVRIGLFVLSAIGVNLVPPLPPVSVPGWHLGPATPGLHNVFTALERQDAAWYLRIATTGYRANDGSAAFFPLYPLIVRAVSWLTLGHPLAAATIVSNAAFIGALVALFGLVADERGDELARRAVVYLAVFPTAFFFLAPFSESLFGFLAIGAFWAARRGRWWLAGAAGALAALTRSVGVVIAPALLVEALAQRREATARWWPSLAAPVLVVAGWLSYFGYWALRGDALAPWRAQRNWQRVAHPAWWTLWHAADLAIRMIGSRGGGYWLIDLTIVGIVLALVIAGASRLRASHQVYAWLSLLVPLSYPFPPRPLLSVPRFAVVIFPAFIVLADLTARRRIPHAAVLAAFAAGYGLLAVLFMNWYYIF